jgi:hypothetical protein
LPGVDGSLHQDRGAEIDHARVVFAVRSVLRRWVVDAGCAVVVGTVTRLRGAGEVARVGGLWVGRCGSRKDGGKSGETELHGEVLIIKME